MQYQIKTMAIPDFDREILYEIHKAGCKHLFKEGHNSKIIECENAEMLKEKQDKDEANNGWKHKIMNCC